MHPVSCTNTYHVVVDLVNRNMVKNTKAGEQSITFIQNKNC